MGPSQSSPELNAKSQFTQLHTSVGQAWKTHWLIRGCATLTFTVKDPDFKCTGWTNGWTWQLGQMLSLSVWVEKTCTLTTQRPDGGDVTDQSMPGLVYLVFGLQHFRGQVLTVHQRVRGKCVSVCHRVHCKDHTYWGSFWLLPCNWFIDMCPLTNWRCPRLSTEIAPSKRRPAKRVFLRNTTKSLWNSELWVHPKSNPSFPLHLRPWVSFPCTQFFNPIFNILILHCDWGVSNTRRIRSQHKLTNHFQGLVLTFLQHRSEFCVSRSALRHDWMWSCNG